MFPQRPQKKRFTGNALTPLTQNLTPQGKIGQVSKKLGIPGIVKQQGTTVVKYDTLPLDGRTQYEFFKGSQNRPFPFSNTGSDGGKLGVGESLVIQRITLAIIVQDAVTGQIEEINPVDNRTVGIMDGEITIQTANNNVLLSFPISQTFPQFNKNAENSLNFSYEFDTLLVIPPQVDYQFNLKVSGVTTANSQLRLTIEGVGSILNLQNTL